MNNVYHLTRVSTNAKTGPIPVTTTSGDTCPVTCGLREVCYAKGGPLRLHWDKVTRGERGGTLGELTAQIDKFPAGQLWRHNQAGDLPGDGSSIDREALSAIVNANAQKKRRGFTYTHYRPEIADNAQAIKAANAGGFTINLSADNLSMADELSDLDIAPVVCVLPSDTGKKSARTPSGRPVMVCPATYRDDVQCSTCERCQYGKERGYIVGFPAHGPKKRAADAVTRLSE